MKFICEVIIVSVFYLFLFSFLSGCSINNSHIISTNSYIQTDYDYQCLDESKTFTKIITCYQLQDKAEKEQNRITNKMILQNSKQ